VDRGTELLEQVSQVLCCLKLWDVPNARQRVLLRMINTLRDALDPDTIRIVD
jgi:hypothetical protein